MTITLARDDIPPLLEAYDVEVGLEALSAYLPDMARLKYFMDEFCIDHDIKLHDFSPAQIQQLVADLVLAEKLVGVEIAEGSNVPAIPREAAPAGLGLAGGNVWVTPPEGSYVLRFYVNGSLKKTLTDYYITTLESLGAEPGDVVQVCRVVPVIVDEEEVGHVVGWMTSAAVP